MPLALGKLLEYRREYLVPAIAITKHGKAD